MVHNILIVSIEFYIVLYVEENGQENDIGEQEREHGQEDADHVYLFLLELIVVTFSHDV